MIAIVMLVGAIVIGLYFPMYIDQSTWHIIVFIYVLIASVAPVWALLQPRDYLNSYLLVAMILAAIVGVFVAQPAVNLPAFTGFVVKGQSMFPILFVTIACGAVSGFHSLVSSGTASKQIKKRKEYAAGLLWRYADGIHAGCHRFDCSGFLCFYGCSKKPGTHYPAPDLRRRRVQFPPGCWPAQGYCVYAD